MIGQKYLGKVIICLLLVALQHKAQAQNADAKTAKPNIIFILADDLGYADAGCYGQQKIATPNIDQLARQGMRFTQFYAGTTVCAPSRASLMTGMHTGHTPIRGNLEIEPEGQFPLPDSSVIIAQVLKQNGYTTAAFGKWGMGYPGSTGEPLKKGFDHFYGYNCQSLAHNYYPDHLWNNEAKVELKGNLVTDSVYSADLIHQQAMRFLNGGHQKPFFLFLPYTLPHASLHGPHDSLYQYYVSLFHEQPLTAPATVKKGGYTFEAYPHAAYAAMVSRLDKYVGEIYASVKKQGLEKNTLILFASDNGPHREGGGDPDFFNSSGPFRGIKRDLYEGGIRVPFIAVWSGKIKPGVTNNQPGAFWDLFPTFQQLAGIKPANNIDGISIVPSLLGTKQPQHAYFYWEFQENNGRQAVRLGNWKAVRLNVSTTADSPIELYDLQTDEGEKNNVAAAHPEVITQIKKILAAAHVQDKNWPLLLSEKRFTGHRKIKAKREYA